MSAGRVLARLLSAWLPVVLWIGVISWLSGDRFSDTQTASWLLRIPWVAALDLPPAVLAVANWILRKTAHFVEYATLGGLSYRAWARTLTRRAPRTILLLAVVVAAACALSDEVHQTMTQSRTGSPKDVALDVCGAATGAWLNHRARRRRARPTPPAT